MRILHVIYDDVGNPWLGGGGATRTLELYSRIARQGHRVVVVCGSYPGAATREIRRGVVYRRVGSARSYVVSRLAFVAGAARLIKRGGYDIVIEDVSPFSPVGSPIWKPKNVPSVASVQNLSGAHATAKYGPAGWGPRLVERPLLSLFTNFIAVSPGIAEQLRAMRGPKIEVRVVPNSVSPDFFAGGEGESAGAPYVLSLGRIDLYQKGLDRLLRAFDLLGERAPGVRLLIAGGGTPEQMKELGVLAAGSAHAERVAVLGPVSPARAARLMRGALLLAMPSRYEAWPLTALEAGAVGTPVVGSDVVGVRDAAPAYPEGHGVLVEEGDVEALAEAMLRLVEEPGLREEIGAKGRAWAARYTWDALAEAQLDFYRELIGREG